MPQPVALERTLIGGDSLWWRRCYSWVDEIVSSVVANDTGGDTESSNQPLEQEGGRVGLSHCSGWLPIYSLYLRGVASISGRHHVMTCHLCTFSHFPILLYSLSLPCLWSLHLLCITCADWCMWVKLKKILEVSVGPAMRFRVSSVSLVWRVWAMVNLPIGA